MISLHHIRVALATGAALTALVALACTTTSLHRPATGETLRLTHHVTPLATPGCLEAGTLERISGAGPEGTAAGPDAVGYRHYLPAAPWGGISFPGTAESDPQPRR